MRPPRARVGVLIPNTSRGPTPSAAARRAGQGRRSRVVPLPPTCPAAPNISPNHTAAGAINSIGTVIVVIATISAATAIAIIINAATTTTRSYAAAGGAAKVALQPAGRVPRVGRGQLC